MLNEEETRAQLVDAKLRESEWKDNMIERGPFITKGMIINESGDRLPPRNPDYILYYPDKSGVPLPSLEEQKHIITYLDKIRETVESFRKLQQNIDEELEN